MPLLPAASLALQLLCAAGLLQPSALASHLAAARADGRDVDTAALAKAASAGPSTPATTAIAAAAASAEGDDEGDEDDADVTEESESEAGGAAATVIPNSEHPYSGDLSDAELKRRWTSDLASVGSVSVGFADLGRVINAVHVPEGAAWTCVRPDLAWGARETVDGLVAAFTAVHNEFPDSVPARLNHIGQRDGGWLRPHRSHQSGRDADIGFFYKRDVIPHGRVRREKLIDPARSWALVRALVTLADVQFVLVDRGIQAVLRKHALSIGEDPAWVDSLFHGGRAALIQHARRHRDHFHVRFYAPRSQELGRRLQPLLAARPEQNLVVHKVKPGQTVGHIARIYKTTVASVLKANHMRRSFLRVGQRLNVPLRGPCTRCPVVPALLVPERRLPPKLAQAAGAGGAEGLPERSHGGLGSR